MQKQKKMLEKKLSRKLPESSSYKKVEMNFKRNLLMFHTKETEMRQFDNSTEITYLSKTADNLNEVMDQLLKDQKDMKAKQDQAFILIKNIVEEKKKEVEESERAKQSDMDEQESELFMKEAP